jgi:DnaJ-class molecular chaperone
MTTMVLTSTDEKCVYCDGDGYVQLLLGGSETCGCCQGTGRQTNETK